MQLEDSSYIGKKQQLSKHQKEIKFLVLYHFQMNFEINMEAT